MPKNLKRNKQKRAKEAQSFKEVPSRMMTRFEHGRQNIFKLLTNPNNQNCSEFVIFNKQATFEKLDRQLLDKIKDFANKGFLNFLFLNIVRYLRSR